MTEITDAVVEGGNNCIVGGSGVKAIICRITVKNYINTPSM